MAKSIKTYPPTKLCAKCKGKCCKTMGGHYSPEDFKDLSFEALKAAIDKGNISIDWYENDEPEYYLRARHIDGNIVEPAWFGTCINLTPEGCALSWEERPTGCKAVEPKVSGCDTCYTKEQCKNDWKPYAETLNNLVEHYGYSYRHAMFDVLSGLFGSL